MRNGILAILLGLALGGPSGAEDLSRAFGHSVDLVIPKEFGDERTLSVDGRVLLRQDYIDLRETAIVDGVGVVIGYAGPGGNACDASPFVLSFPKGSAPRLDGPVDACGAKAVVKDGSVTVETTALVGKPGKSWKWDARKGFVRMAAVRKAVSAESGWDKLRSREVMHPYSFLDYRDTSAQLSALLGRDMEAVRPILMGPGSGAVDGMAYRGTSCENHNCNATGLMIYADIPTRRIYVAWFSDARPSIVVSPAVGQWPSEARQRLKAWSGSVRPKG